MTTDLTTKGNEMITTKELAEQLGTSVKVVLENARKCLPNKEIRNGKPTYWSKEEVTVVLEQMKCNQVNGRTFPNLSVELKGIERCNRDSSITTMQFAKQLGTTPNVVLENARKCLPNKEVQNGKPTYWTKEEVTIVLDYMKAHTSNNRSVELNTTVANTSTDMTPALKLRKAMELANEAYQEEIERLKALNIEVLNENGQLKLVAKQAVERAEAAEKKTEEVFEYNRNFHNHLYTATELGKTLGTTSNNIGRIANKLGLKREPEYGKLGKIQLPDGRWADQFYYNDNAVDKIKVALLMTE